MIVANSSFSSLNAAPIATVTSNPATKPSTVTNTAIQKSVSTSVVVNISSQAKAISAVQNGTVMAAAATTPSNYSAKELFEKIPDASWTSWVGGQAAFNVIGKASEVSSILDRMQSAGKKSSQSRSPTNHQHLLHCLQPN